MSNSKSSSTHPKVKALLTSIANGEPLTRVDLSNCELHEIPKEIFSLSETLEFLNFGGNELTTLPDDMAGLQRLRILFFERNKFEEVPLILNRLSNLYMLSFKSNRYEYTSPFPPISSSY